MNTRIVRVARQHRNIAVSLAALVALAAGIGVGSYLLLRAEPGEAVQPTAVFYRDGALMVADLTGISETQIAPASATAIYGGWVELPGGRTAVVYAVAEGDGSVIRQTFLDGGRDEAVATVALEDLTGLRVSPDGSQAVAVANSKLHLVDMASGQVSPIEVSGDVGEFTEFSVRDWSPDGSLVLTWALHESGEGGTHLILEAASGEVLGTIPGLSASWSDDGSAVCGSVGGPAGFGLPRLWVSSGPSWEPTEAISETVLPVNSCDWLDRGQVVFATEPWPLDEGQTSPLPSVTAEVYGAEDKTRPEETRVFLGTTTYTLPVVGIADIGSGKVRTVYALRPDLAPDSVVEEIEIREALSPLVVVAPGAHQAIVSTRVNPPAAIDLTSGERLASLQPGDRVIDIVEP